MTSRAPDELVALSRVEDAIGDVVALISAYLDDDLTAEQAEADRIVAARDGESPEERVLRISRTVGMAGLLCSNFLDLAAGMITDPNVDARAVLQRYALAITAGHERRRAIACRCTPDGQRGYCPLCGCVKSGTLGLPNGRARLCPDEGCVCHAHEEPS